MQHFEYQQNKHKLQILKRLYIPLALLSLAGFYIAWTLTQFSSQELWLIARSALVVLGPIGLLVIALFTFHYWINQWRQTDFPSLTIEDTHLCLKDGDVHEIVYFDKMHSIRLVKSGSTREAIQIILHSGQSILIHSNFPIEPIKTLLNDLLDCKL
ncbi:hypothetical protein Patl_2250 [Paraglaciecola sp. T6c]|uniref:hypothetical protein n=1 Tax=Pseudoalteromonas atlantica (strain T6c / ATCC BAA-1087) TaxID=3042615 RepID=UPI00005C6F9E|nr:hypothetical protein [Paraglaciecola sp. T6c]ABG40768.1 hypothetical protein Patl_2250 [Paraglaciecola sp. T6c]